MELKNERGFVTMYVLIVVLFVMLILIRKIYCT